MQHSPELAGLAAASSFSYIRRPGSNACLDPAFVFYWSAPTGCFEDVLLKRGLLALVLPIYSMTSCLTPRTPSSTPHFLCQDYRSVDQTSDPSVAVPPSSRSTGRAHDHTDALVARWVLSKRLFSQPHSECAGLCRVEDVQRAVRIHAKRGRGSWTESGEIIRMDVREALRGCIGKGVPGTGHLDLFGTSHEHQQFAR